MRRETDAMHSARHIESQDVEGEGVVSEAIARNGKRIAIAIPVFTRPKPALFYLRDTLRSMLAS